MIKLHIWLSREANNCALLQTVIALHETVPLVHLDISCKNVMLQPGACLWDLVRLVGFSSAQRCSPGTLRLSLGSSALLFGVADHLSAALPSCHSQNMQD